MTEECEATNTLLIPRRSKIEQAPKDILRLEHLKPKGKEGMGDRLASAISQEKRLEEMAKPVVSKAEKKKRKEKYVEEGGSDDDLEDMEDDVEEGVDWGEED